jgi:hypothetical protein
VVFDSNALASACVPTAPIWLTGIPLPQHTSPTCSGKRTAEIQRGQSDVRLQRSGKRLRARFADQVGCDRTAASLPIDIHTSSGIRTIENKPSEGAV